MAVYACDPIFEFLIKFLNAIKFQDEVEKDVKVFRNAKHSKTKKTLEKFQAIQKELQLTVSEVTETHS
jgi:hypothetical protein